MLKSWCWKQAFATFLNFLGRWVLGESSTRSLVQRGTTCVDSPKCLSRAHIVCLWAVAALPTADSNLPLSQKISCFFSGKIARWQSNPEWFDLPEHENCLSPTLITQRQMREALNFSLQYKNNSNKNDHWSVEVLVKTSERDYNLTGSIFL